MKAGNKAECIIYGGLVKCRSYFSRLWTKDCNVFEEYRGQSVVSNAIFRLSISCFVDDVSFGRYVANNRLKSQIGSFPQVRSMDPKFWMCIFKVGSLPNMWQGLVELRSVSSEGAGENRNKKHI